VCVCLSSASAGAAKRTTQGLLQFLRKETRPSSFQRVQYRTFAFVVRAGTNEIDTQTNRDHIIASIKASDVSCMSLVVPVVPAKETALGEMKENDVDEQRRDTVSKGWSKDQWISGVLERAIGIVARSAENGLQKFRLVPLEAGTARYAVSDDKHLSTFYEKQTGQFKTRHLAKFFPIRNIDLEMDGEIIHVQGTQKPDSISLLKLSDADGVNAPKTVCICFEGEGHDKDTDKSHSGMFLHEKMFDDAALCHDVNASVPAIFIASVLLTHDKSLFPVFEDWSEQYLKEHVMLVEKLLQYIHNPKTSSIYRQLREIDKDMSDKEFEGLEFDFYCWINAKSDGSETVESDTAECFDLLHRPDKKQHGSELHAVLDWRKMCVSAADNSLGTNGQRTDATNAFGASTDGLAKNKFKARVLTWRNNGIPVVVFAVPRVSRSDIDLLALDQSHVCSGMWYPMHVEYYIQQLNGKDMDNFLVPPAVRAKLTFEGVLSSMRPTNRTNTITEQEFKRTYMDKLFGHIVFALPWLWVNLGFLCQLKKSLNYRVLKNATNTLQTYITFTRKHSTQISSRDTVENAMQMFPAKSGSLFSHLCQLKHAEVGLDEDLAIFFRQKCGWVNADSACSPAVFFKMIGASNLITAHTLAKQLQRKTTLNDKVELVKATFPLAAQVEIDYALECLCRHYYFVQDKTLERDGLVTMQEFLKMKRRLEKQLKDARRDGELPDVLDVAAAPAQPLQQAPPAQQAPQAPQRPQVPLPVAEQDDDGTGYKVDAGYKLAESDDINDNVEESVMQKNIAHKVEMATNPGEAKLYRWFQGQICGKKQKNPNQGYFCITYPGKKKQYFVKLTKAEYGCTKTWVLFLDNAVAP
jgi:hypothetical protein